MSDQEVGMELCPIPECCEEGCRASALSAAVSVRSRPRRTVTAILSTLPTILSFVGILSMIIIRTLRKDIANYNKEDDIVSPG